MDASSTHCPILPLRLHHLLARTLTSAFIGVWFTGAESLTKQDSPRLLAEFDSIYYSALNAATIVTTGGMLALSVYGIRWKIRSDLLRWPPGIWLALFGVTEFLLIVLNFQWWRIEGTTDGKLAAMWVCDLIVRVIWLSAFCAFTIRSCTTANWRAAFGALALSQLVEAIISAVLFVDVFNGFAIFPRSWVGSVFDVLLDGLDYIAIMIVGVAVGVDLFRRRKKTWPHWAGVSLWLAENATYFVTTLIP